MKTRDRITKTARPDSLVGMDKADWIILEKANK